MTETVYICEGCRQQIGLDDVVVDAARQLDVTTFDSHGEREYIDGLHGFFHPSHWPGDSDYWREPGRGTLGSFIGR